MKFIINDKSYVVEPHTCSSENEFPFYINITNACNAKCEFCLNACNKDVGKLDLVELKTILDKISPHISRISISGGESLLYPEELEKLLKLVQEYNKTIIVNTNGSFLIQNVEMLNKYDIESIQLSRHHYEDDKNDELFKIKTISFEELKKIQLNADLRINCLLIKNYIDSKEEIINFLEKISETEIAQVGFISMTQVNDYAKQNFVDYRYIINDLGPDFVETQRLCDGNECSCNHNLYVAKNGKTIFVYFRYKRENCETGRSLFFDTNGLKEGY